MGPVAIAVLCAAAAGLLLAAAVVTVVLRRDRRVRAGLVTELAETRAESTELRARLDELERTARRREVSPVLPAEFLITDAGDTRLPDREPPSVPDRVVLSATLGEPLVRALALAHGVRRALSAESRNRIRFAMRQEVRRTRRQRRREMKDAWRRMQSEQRTAGDGAARREARDIA
jgi:hypothetical protein